MPTMTPLYTVEDYGEWRMEVYNEYIVTVDYYEDFAEVSLNVEV